VRGVWSAEELRRAMENLVTNAVKYGTAGAPITVCIEHTGEGARISVHNLGTPIPKEDQARLFDPSFRTRSAQAGPAQGWGLGLTLVRGCAEAHGGIASVSSDARHGTTFALELPLDSRPFQPQPSDPSGPPAQAEALPP
jgi:signal transduction histidine kinase